MRNFPNDMEPPPVSRLEKGALMRQAAGIALCAILLSGCCIPVRRSQNVAHVPCILRQRPKLDGVVEGITTRHELDQILSGFSTNASDREFFWARWQEPSDPHFGGRSSIIRATTQSPHAASAHDLHGPNGDAGKSEMVR